MKTITLILALSCLSAVAATRKRSGTKGAESLTSTALVKDKSTTLTPPAPPGFTTTSDSPKSVQVDTSAMRFAPASVDNPQHGFGANFGGPVSGYVGQTATLSGHYSNWDDFGDTHLWTSFTIDYNVTTTSNLIAPGATVTLTPFRTEPGYPVTFTLASNSIAIPPRWYATVNYPITLSGSGVIVLCADIQGMDPNAGGTGTLVGHQIAILTGIYLRAQDVGNDVRVSMTLPAGVPVTLETSPDLTTWSVAETFPPMPAALDVSRSYPHSEAKRFFRTRQ